MTNFEELKMYEEDDDQGDFDSYEDDSDDDY